MRTLRAKVAVVAALVGILASCADDPTPIHDLPVEEAGVPEAGAEKPEGGSLVDAPSLIGGQVDRAGRPAIAVAVLPSARRDAFNRLRQTDDPFPFKQDFETGLVALDQLDGVDNWGSPHPAIALMSFDVLLVDTTKPYSTTGFLEIENEIMAGGAAHATCGGRTPQEDAVDKLYSFLVAKKLTGVSDGVSAATKAPTSTFPYLASPE